MIPETFWAFLGGAGLASLVFLLLWFTVPPELPAFPKILKFEFAPKPAAPGEPVFITWNTENAAVVHLQAVGDAQACLVSRSGHLEVTATQDYQWTLTVTGARGETVSQTLTLERAGWARKAMAGCLLALAGIFALGCGGTTRELIQPHILTFKADPPEVSNGLTTTLQWTVTGAARAIMEPGGDVTGKATLKVLPDASQSYVLTVWSADGLVDRGRVDVTVLFHKAAAPEEGGER